MAARAKIHADFDTIDKNYPRNKAPSPIKTFFDKWQADVNKRNEDKGLKKGDKGYEAIPTQCCYQVSQALNAVEGHKIPSNSYRRPNATIPGGNGFYINAVDEMEQYLTTRYGPGEDISAKGGAAARVKYLTDQKIKALICMRDSGAGMHTEFWDGSKILQKDDPQASMTQDAVMGTNRILVWEIASAAKAVVPDWLRGWWSVSDGENYYYYFNSEGDCYWTHLDPLKSAYPPRPSSSNAASVETSGVPPHVTLKWEHWGTVEQFSIIPWALVTSMMGTSNNGPPLLATKLLIPSLISIPT